MSAPGPPLPPPRPPPPGRPPDSSIGFPSFPSPCPPPAPMPTLLLSLPIPGPSLGPEQWGQGVTGMGGKSQGRYPGGWGVGGESGWLLVTCSLPQAEAAGNLEVVTFLQKLQGGAGAQAPGPVSPSAPRRTEGFPMRLDPGLGNVSKGQSWGQSQRRLGWVRVSQACRVLSADGARTV